MKGTLARMRQPCDRIYEGTSEIQKLIIARQLLDGDN